MCSVLWLSAWLWSGHLGRWVSCGCLADWVGEVPSSAHLSAASASVYQRSDTFIMLHVLHRLPLILAGTACSLRVSAPDTAFTFLKTGMLRVIVIKHTIAYWPVEYWRESWNMSDTMYRFDPYLTHIWPIFDPYLTHIWPIFDPYWTHWTQIGHRLDTDWTQIGHRLDTDLTQIWHRFDADLTLILMLILTLIYIDLLNIGAWRPKGPVLTKLDG